MSTIEGYKFHRCKFGLAVFVAGIVLAGFTFVQAGTPSQTTRLHERSFEFTYRVRVPALPAGSHEMRLWLPLPVTSEHQQISALRLRSPLPYRVYREPVYGDRYAYFDVSAARRKAPLEILLTFHVRRLEYKVPLPATDPPVSVAAFAASVERYLQPTRLIPINGIIAELSREQTEGVKDPLEKARKIYDYVIATMHYDHNGTGWGRGDAIYACTAHHGNCTDFHSLFIGMARAAGIPAQFEIGFPLPLDQHEGKISGYHCWAQFYIQGTGWIPIDASQAWLNPQKRNYFFGAIDENRVMFTRGRDIVVTPPPNEPPLNFFVYPYAEVDGKPYDKVEHEFSFRDLPARGK